MLHRHYTLWFSWCSYIEIVIFVSFLIISGENKGSIWEMFSKIVFKNTLILCFLIVKYIFLSQKLKIAFEHG